MSVHPSLSTKGKDRGNRSVLKRFERLKQMEEKGEWDPGNPVFGLPKLKTLRLKLKKGKKDSEAEATAEQPTAGASEKTAQSKQDAGKKK